MGFMDGLISGALGFATGGPIVGAAGFLGGLLGGGSSSGGRSGPNLNRPANLDYFEVARRKAAFDGYQQGFGAPQQGGGQQQSSSGSRVGGLSQFANQRGGQNSGGSQQQAMSAIGQQEAGTMPSVDIGEAYRSFLGNAMIGNETIPGAQNAQYAAGQQTIDAQTHQAREQLLQQMSNRGLLRSGMTSTGLAEVETGRAQSLAQLSAELERQRQQQLLQTQQFAASAIGGQQMQEREIQAAQPSWGETLGGALQAYGQYHAMRNAPDPYAQLMQGILSQQQGAGANPAVAHSPAPVVPMLPGAPVAPEHQPHTPRQRTTTPYAPLARQNIYYD